MVPLPDRHAELRANEAGSFYASALFITAQSHKGQTLAASGAHLISASVRKGFPQWTVQRHAFTVNHRTPGYIGRAAGAVRGSCQQGPWFTANRCEEGCKVTDQLLDTSDRGEDPMTGDNSDPRAQTPVEQPLDSSPTPPAVSAERISQRAYEIYVERGGEHGRDTDDWFRAEAELTNTPS
jgi:hypothetical protein